MARDVKIGITITAKSNADGLLEKIKGAAQDAGGKVTNLGKESKDAGEQGARATSTFGEKLRTLDAAFRLAQAAASMFKQAVVGTFDAALQFRTVHDATSKQFEQFGRSLEVLRARFGDALLPVLQGFMDVMKPVVASINNWLVANQKLIGTKFLEWVTSIARALVTGVAEGAVLVVRAWGGWALIIDSVKGGVEAFFALLTDGVSKAIGAMARLAEVTGAVDTAKSLRSAQAAVTGLSEEFDRSFRASVEDTNRQITAMDAMEAKVRSVAATFQDSIGNVAVATQKRLQNATIGANRTIEDQQRIKAAQQQHYAEMLKADEIYQRGLNETAEANLARRVDLTNQAYDQMEQRMQAAADTLATTFTQSFDGVLQGTKTLGAAFKDFFSSLGKMILMAAIQWVVAEGIKRAASIATGETETVVNASVGAGSAISAHAGIPFVGIAIGLAAAAAIVAAIYAAKKFATGGLVTGGSPGKDSVLGLLMPGERVLTVEENKAFERIFKRAGASTNTAPVHMASGGVVMPTAGNAIGQRQAPLQVNVQVQTLTPPNQQEWDRLVRDQIGASLQRLGRLGMVR